MKNNLVAAPGVSRGFVPGFQAAILLLIRESERLKALEREVRHHAAG
ncbi:MAG: hypothetical protein V4671_11025 [Armatimonadota bacterium]